MRYTQTLPVNEVNTTDWPGRRALFMGHCKQLGDHIGNNVELGNDRIKNYKDIAYLARAMADKDIAPGKDSIIVEYTMDTNVPVGFLQLLTATNDSATESFIHVDQIACNPGLEGCAGALIEYAARYSEDHNLEGRLSLYAGDDALITAYKRYGFVERDLNQANMTLAPSDSPIWYRDNNGWRLTTMPRGYIV